MVDKCSSPVVGHIFLWNWSTRLVVSDIDGTITKSDLRGQIYPLFGNDWSQPGVAQLFSEIHSNGYEFLYLSCRPMMVSNTTRKYIAKIRQGEHRLPAGPIMVSTNAVLSSIMMEVVRRNPEKYKIPALKQVQALFPDGRCPFHAAYGNKGSDLVSYKSVGIARECIFIVNKKGMVTCEGKKGPTTYAGIAESVSTLFPKWT